MNITSLDKRARRIALAEMIKACAAELCREGEVLAGNNIIREANKVVDLEREQMADTLKLMGSFVLVAEAKEPGT